MQPIPMVPARALRPLFQFVGASGVKTSAHFARARAALGDSRALLPLSVGGVLWEDAARALGRIDLGLRVGEATPLEDAGEIGPVARRARTVGAALEATARLGTRFNSGQHFWMVRRGEEVCWHYAYAPALRHGRAQVNEFVLTAVLHLIRLGAGGSWRPSEIHFEGDPPPYAEELAALARHSVRFGQRHTTVVFPRRVLSLALPLTRIPGDRAGAASIPRPAADFAGSARQAVASLLRLGRPDLAAAADAAGTSVRTFQRRLLQVGLNFAALVDETRFEAARRLLSDPAAKVIQVSAELGYTDSANFTRAFRRWTGLPPQRYRRLAAP